MMNDDEEILAVARAGFLDEAAEMLGQFEQALLVMESDPTDAENLNAAFRAAHTIKGTAGLFGFDAVVQFTHEAETLLEALRSAELQVDEHITALLLRSRDQIGDLLDEVRSGVADPQVAALSVELGAALRAARHASAPTSLQGAADKALPSVATPGTTAASASDAGPGAWQISLRFDGDALRNGLDPLSFIRYLDTLGQVRRIRVIQDAIPALEALDAEHCHLGFEIRFDSPASQQAIEQVFDFCAQDCDVAVLPPDASPAQRAELLNRRCPDAADARSLAALWLEMGWTTISAAPAEAQPADRVAGSPSEMAQAAGTGPAQAAGTAEPGKAAPVKERRSSDDTRFIRVRADKLDHLIDLIGELVIASSGAELAAQNEHSPAFMEAAQRISDLVEDARDGALGLRMVPIGDTFARFQRVVRDLSKQLGKEVELQVTGGDTELDKSMVDTISDPLMHLVRNSLDHGIEAADARLAAGKPAQGRLSFNAYQESGSIVIEVSDDGKGLDRDRILAKARERGLIEPDAQLDDDAIYQLIFLPGFSTAEAVTNVSGRGVGMDVVKRNIESLRGHIHVLSRPGHGATMKIRLPLTLAMIDGFLTMVGQVHYVLPLSVVAECIDVPAECLVDPQRICGTFDLRGAVLPYLDLARFYGVSTGDARRRSLIVVRDGTLRIGLVVDRLLGEHQTVIKPLSGIFKHLKALAGSTILGSGAVALVLDMQGLVQVATRSQLPNPASTTPGREHLHGALA